MYKNSLVVGTSLYARMVPTVQLSINQTFAFKRQFGTKSHFEKGPVELMIYKQKHRTSPAGSSGHPEKYGCYGSDRTGPDQHEALYGNGAEKVLFSMRAWRGFPIGFS